jgi:hypothetical protein
MSELQRKLVAGHVPPPTLVSRLIMNTLALKEERNLTPRGSTGRRSKQDGHMERLAQPLTIAIRVDPGETDNEKTWQHAASFGRFMDSRWLDSVSDK